MSAASDNLIIGVCIGLLTGAGLGFAVSDAIHSKHVTFQAACATTPASATTEDEQCGAWLEDGRIVFGPLWLKDAARPGDND